jgi:hypothetical protein
MGHSQNIVILLSMWIETRRTKSKSILDKYASNREKGNDCFFRTKECIFDDAIN